MRHDRRHDLSLLLIAACAVAAGCGGGTSESSSGSQIPQTTLQVAGSVKPADSTVPPLTDPSTSVADTTADTTAPPDVERRPIRSEVPLAAGSYRTTNLVGPDLSLDIDLPQDDLVALDSEGAFLLATDATGEEVLVMVWQLDNAAALEPTADLVRFADLEYAREVSSAIPSDALAWLASRPGVSAGTIESIDVGGVPARRQSFTFGPFDGALACTPSDPALCHVLIWASPTGIAYSVAVEDGLIVTELTVGGHRFAVMQDATINPELAATIAATIRFTPIPHPAAPADSEPLPFAGALETGATYVHERSTGGVWLVPGADGVATISGYLRDRFIRFTDGTAECGSITDGTQGGWFGVEVPPDGAALDGVEIPADLVAAITSAPALRIVAGPTSVDLGEADGVSIDVTPAGTTDVLLANSSHTAVAGATTRIIVAPRPDGGSDLAVVTLGTACEGLLDGLAFLPGAER